MITDRKTFFKTQQKLQNIPFNQAEEWFEKCGYQEINCKFFVDDIGNPQIACWGVIFQRKFIGQHIIINGESYDESITSHHIRDFYKDIISNGFSIIELSSIQFYETKFEIGVRRAGFLRPMFARLSPLTLVIQTNETRKTHKTWNRNIRLATNASLSFKCVENPTNVDIEVFCNIFYELQSQKNLKYSLTPASMTNLFSSQRYKLFFVYNKAQKPIAGRIIYVLGENSFDVHAANSIEAKDCGAAYYIINEIIIYLKNMGVKIFDYGMISPSNNEMDDIYRAKSYSGGIPTLYNGQWVFYKSKILEYLLNGFFYVFKKSSRY